MTRKKETHFVGKHTGYELIDGEYHIATYYIEKFSHLELKKYSLSEMLRLIGKHVAEDLEVIRKGEIKLFDDVKDDLGLDPSGRWIYSNGKVYQEANNEETGIGADKRGT